MKSVDIKTILVPMDFSLPSKTAFDVAKRLGRRYGSQIELVYVDRFSPILLAPTGEVPIDWTLPARESPEFDSLFASAKKEYGKLRAHVLKGSPDEIIARLTADGAPDLVVMGTHGHSALEQFLERSVTEFVVRSSRVPILTVHAGAFAFAPQRILVPYNFSAFAKKALGYAASLAWTFRARLTLLYVVPGGQTSRIEVEKAREGLESAALVLRGVRTDAIVSSGTPEEAILRETQTGLYDLVVLSAHRRRVWTEWVLGTTAERVLRHSRAPVLCVPSEAKERKHRVPRHAAATA